MGALAMIEIDEDPPLGLSLPKSMGFDDWLGLGQRLCAGQRVVNWWIGDWWAFGSHRYGERAKVAAQGLFGREFQTLMNLASVCRSFETSRRRETLSWSHHCEVAALPPGEADRLLDEADASHWSKAELRKRVTAYHQTSFSNDNGRVVDRIDVFADREEPICADFLTADEIIIELAESLGRERALSDRESGFLERAMRRMRVKYGRQTEPWGGEADLILSNGLKERRRVEDIARDLERTPGAVRRRIYKLGGIAKIRQQGSVALPEAAE